MCQINALWWTVVWPTTKGRTLAVGVRDGQTWDFGFLNVSQLVSGRATRNDLNFGAKQNCSFPWHWRYATICERIDLSLIDLKIPLHVFPFLRPVLREVVTSLRKWVEFIFVATCLTLPFHPHLVVFFLSLSRRLHQLSPRHPQHYIVFKTVLTYILVIKHTHAHTRTRARTHTHTHIYIYIYMQKLAEKFMGWLTYSLGMSPNEVYHLTQSPQRSIPFHWYCSALIFDKKSSTEDLAFYEHFRL